MHFPEREVDSAIAQERFDGAQRREHFIVDRLAFGAVGDLLYRCDGNGYPTINRADVAAFMLDAARGREWIVRSAVISD